MSDFKPGDIIICENAAYRVVAIIREDKLTPAGWPIVHTGSRINPRFCRKYNGAISAIEHLLPEEHQVWRGVQSEFSHL